jgi:hypothetical protein
VGSLSPLAGLNSNGMNVGSPGLEAQGYFLAPLAGLSDVRSPKIHSPNSTPAEQILKLEAKHPQLTLEARL